MSDQQSDDDAELPQVALVEGVVVDCTCGWHGWIHPEPYTRPATIERTCPDCGRCLVVSSDIYALPEQEDSL